METFIKLIKRYETITLEEIEDAFKKAGNPANYLTGFGCFDTCSLCRIYFSRTCSNCPWVLLTKYKCNTRDNYETYGCISRAETPAELLDAYRNRAEYMRSVLAPYLKK